MGSADKFDFKPHAKSGSLIWLANHVATVFDWGYQTLSTPSLVIDDFTPPPLPKTSEELMQAFEKSSGQFREQLAAATDQDLTAVWTLTWKGQQMISIASGCRASGHGPQPHDSPSRTAVDVSACARCPGTRLVWTVGG